MTNILRWHRLSTPEGFKIYRDTEGYVDLSGSPTPTPLDDVAGTVNQYEDTTAVPGQDYYYTVVAYDGANVSSEERGFWDGIGAVPGGSGSGSGGVEITSGDAQGFLIDLDDGGSSSALANGYFDNAEIDNVVWDPESGFDAVSYEWEVPAAYNNELMFLTCGLRSTITGRNWTTYLQHRRSGSALVSAQDSNVGAYSDTTSLLAKVQTGDIIRFFLFVPSNGPPLQHKTNCWLSGAVIRGDVSVAAGVASAAPAKGFQFTRSASQSVTTSNGTVPVASMDNEVFDDFSISINSDGDWIVPASADGKYMMFGQSTRTSVADDHFALISHIPAGSPEPAPDLIVADYTDGQSCNTVTGPILVSTGDKIRFELNADNNMSQSAGVSAFLWGAEIGTPADFVGGAVVVPTALEGFMAEPASSVTPASTATNTEVPCTVTIFDPESGIQSGSPNEGEWIVPAAYNNRYMAFGGCCGHESSNQDLQVQLILWRTGSTHGYAFYAEDDTRIGQFSTVVGPVCQVKTGDRLQLRVKSEFSVQTFLPKYTRMWAFVVEGPPQNP